MRTNTYAILLSTLGLAVLVGCASNQYGEGNPSPFSAAAMSWVGHDVRDMAEVFGRPTDYVEGTDAALNPTIVTWVDSNERDIPDYERKPQQVTGYNTNCSTYGNNINCNTSTVTNNNNEDMAEAGYNLGRSITQAGMYRCNISAIVDPDTDIVLDVVTDQKSFSKCAKRHDLVKLTRMPE